MSNDSPPPPDQQPTSPDEAGLVDLVAAPSSEGTLGSEEPSAEAAAPSSSDALPAAASGEGDDDSAGTDIQDTGSPLSSSAADGEGAENESVLAFPNNSYTDSPFPGVTDSPPGGSSAAQELPFEASSGSSSDGQLVLSLEDTELDQRLASLVIEDAVGDAPHPVGSAEDVGSGTEEDDGIFDLRLEEILDANNFLFELRVEKPAIVELLRMAGVLEVLIDFACGFRIAPVKDVLDEAESFQVHQRRSVVALQALEIDWILGIVIREDDLLDRLFNFLKTKINGQSDHVPSAAFARVVELLFDRFPNELVTYFLSRDWIVEHFVENVTDPSLMDLLYHFVDSRVTHQWLYEHSLIHFLVALFLYCHDPLKHEAASDVLVQLFTICQRWTDSQLVNELFKKEEITDQLLQHASKVGDYQTQSIRQGLSVVNAILSLLLMTNEEPTFVPVICSRLGHFVSLLRGVVPPYQAGQVPSPAQPVVSDIPRANQHDDTCALQLSNREVVAPAFGSTRMKILEFITTAMMCNCPEITQQLHIDGFFDICVDLFFHYKWNNFLHSHVDQILASFFSYGDSGLVIAVLESTQLPHRIIPNFTREDVGYRGHLVNILRELIKLSSENRIISEHLNAIPGWEEFLAGPYQETEIRFQTQIGGDILPIDWDSGTKEEHLFQLLSQIGGESANSFEGDEYGQYQDEIDEEYEHDYEGNPGDDGSSEEEYPEEHGDDD